MSTKKAKVPKAAPKAKAASAAPKAKKLMPINEYMDKLGEAAEEEGDEMEGGKIRMILKLWIKGYTRKEIKEAGYNKSTIYRQVGEFEKLKKAPAYQYQGYDVYEARIQKLIKSKSVSRAKAVELLAEVDSIAIDKIQQEEGK